MSYEQGYARGQEACRIATQDPVYWRLYEYAHVIGYGHILLSQIKEQIVAKDWCDGFLAGWKSEEQEVPPRVRSTEETPSFTRGVLSGYHLYGESRAHSTERFDSVAYYENDGQENLLAYIRRCLAKMTEPVVPSEWADGFVAGWNVRMEQQ